MDYQILRDGQHYGPYKLDDLRRYVGTGNILLTDMVRAVEGGESAPWITVGELLGEGGVSPVTPPYAPPVPPVEAYAPTGAYAAGAAAYSEPVAPAYSSAIEPPPNFPWWAYLLISLFTGGTYSPFIFVWNFINALWLKRIEPMSNAVTLMGANIALHVVALWAWARTVDWTMFAHIQPGMHVNRQTHPLVSLIGFAAWIVKLVWRFSQRADLERHYNTVEPIGLRLSGVMTFFFGGLYFQYHYNKINEIKRAAAFQGYPGPR